MKRIQIFELNSAKNNSSIISMQIKHEVEESWVKVTHLFESNYDRNYSIVLITWKTNVNMEDLHKYNWEIFELNSTK